MPSLKRSRVAHVQGIIIIIHEFHRDASLETKLQGRYVSRITLHYSCKLCQCCCGR